MSQRKETQSNQPSNKTKSKSLFTPLDQQEQQTLTGGWAWRSSPSSPNRIFW